MRHSRLQRWLYGNGLPIELLEQKWGLPNAAIIQGARKVSRRVSRGEEIKQLQLGWEIRKEAQLLAKTTEIKNIRKLEDALREIDRLKSKQKKGFIKRFFSRGDKDE